MEASINKDMQAGSVKLGVSAQILNMNNKKANIIKNRYFKI